MSGPGAVPYVVGQWVRGTRFYGRSALLHQLLAGTRPATWVAGTRRIGKTSLLKQLELLATGSEPPCVPLYWDLQGADSPDELNATFGDAVLDVGETLSGMGVDPERIVGLPLFAAVERLLALVASRGRTLLLLVDEAEEVVGLAARHGDTVGRLAELLDREGLRTVLVASVRLDDLAGRGSDPASLLELVSPPILLPPLGEEEAAALVRQEHLPAESRPQLTEPLVKAVCGWCGNHPFLLQLLAKRVLESGDLAGSVEHLQHDRVLHHLFAVDLGLLPPAERELLEDVARGGRGGTGDASRLLGLGLLRRGPDGEMVVGNELLARWLARTSPDPHRKLT